jgi:hypothetical protein
MYPEVKYQDWSVITIKAPTEMFDMIERLCDEYHESRSGMGKLLLAKGLEALGQGDWLTMAVQATTEGREQRRVEETLNRISDAVRETLIHLIKEE